MRIQILFCQIADICIPWLLLVVSEFPYGKGRMVPSRPGCGLSRRTSFPHLHYIDTEDIAMSLPFLSLRSNSFISSRRNKVRHSLRKQPAGNIIPQAPHAPYEQRQSRKLETAGPPGGFKPETSQKEQSVLNFAPGLRPVPFRQGPREIPQTGKDENETRNFRFCFCIFPVCRDRRRRSPVRAGRNPV